MKKYFKFSMLMVLLMTLCVGLSSCSDDDNDDGGGSSSFIINNEKYSVIDVAFERFKNGSEQYKDYCLGVIFGEMNNPSNFEIYWDYAKINFNNLKIGDELPMPFQTMSYWEKAINSGDNTRHCKYFSGTITVESIDATNKKLKLRFRDFKIIKNNTTELIIKGDLNVDHMNW